MDCFSVIDAGLEHEFPESDKTARLLEIELDTLSVGDTQHPVGPQQLLRARYC